MAGPKVEGYILSPDDYNRIKRLVKEFDERYVGYRRENEDDALITVTTNTEVYIARTPASGIPGIDYTGSGGTGTGTGTAGVESLPGSAECNIYKISRADERITNISVYVKNVYNISPNAIPGNRFILVAKDKFGSWLAIWSGVQIIYRDECYGGFLYRYKTEDDGDSWEIDEYLGLECNVGTGTGTGTGTGGGGSTSVDGPGWTAGLSDEDCLQLTVTASSGKCSTIDTSQVLTLISDDGLSWVSTEDFQYSGGSGPVVFTRSGPIPSLTINGIGLIWNAARSGIGTAYIDYMGGGAICNDSGTGSGTGGTRDACGGNTFTVRLECVDCPMVTVGCCVEEVPFSLTAVVTGNALFDGTYTLEYAGDNTWEYIAEVTWGECSGPMVALILRCEEDGITWGLYTEQFIAGPFTDEEMTCSPFSFTTTATFPTCGSSSTATVTISG